MAKARNSIRPPARQDDPRCHLFRLPAELRLIIYDIALTDLDNLNKAAQEESTGFITALMNTCQVITQEAASIYVDQLRKAGDRFKAEYKPRLRAFACDCRFTGLEHYTKPYRSKRGVVKDEILFVKLFGYLRKDY